MEVVNISCPLTGKFCKSLDRCINSNMTLDRGMTCYKMNHPAFEEARERIKSNKTYAITLVPFINNETIAE